MRNIRLTIEYRGTDYRGLQRQLDRPTVQGELEKALAVLLRDKPKITAASRTDRGVHATGQVVNFKTASRMTVGRVKRALNGLLPDDIAVREACQVPDSFHARRDAKLREYRYSILDRREPSPIQREFVYHVPQALDVEQMQEALKVLIGTHDFVSFCVATSSKKGCVRTIEAARIERRDDLVELTVRADAFVHQMIRTIVGTLVEIGQGKRPAADMAGILAARDRRQAGKTAPPSGLTLTRIWYEDICDKGT